MAIERLKEIWPDWEIIEPIGAGAFGRVYKAVNKEAGFKAYSAIKEISIPSGDAELDSLRSEGLSDNEISKYFESIALDFTNEIKLMNELKGAPNIVNVEDFAIREKPRGVGYDIFIRMELLTPFKSYIDSTLHTENEIIKLGCDIATALEICHGKNIIHRDIKPANIFIDPYGSFKLGDFGIAKELEKTTGALSSKGTLTFMAPEVAKGTRYTAGVDIYSLGLVLYTMLNNNRPPFTSTTADYLTYKDRSDANDRRLSGEVLPPPCNASPLLSDIILTACAYDPDKRFKSATAFKNALKNCMNMASPTPVSLPSSKSEKELDSTVAVHRPEPSKKQYAQPPVFPTPPPRAEAIRLEPKQAVKPVKNNDLNRVNPSIAAKIFAVSSPLFILELYIVLDRILKTSYAGALCVGITAGFFTCITFFYPLKYAGIFFCLHMTSGIIGAVMDIDLNIIIYILPLISILVCDSFKKKKPTSALKVKIIAAVTSASNYIIVLLMCAVIYFADGAHQALDSLNTVYDTPVVILISVSVIASVSAATIIYNMTIAKHRKSN